MIYRKIFLNEKPNRRKRRGTRKEAHNKATTLLVRQRNRRFSVRNDFFSVQKARAFLYQR